MKNLVQKYSFLACTALLSIPAAEGAVILWSTSLYPVTGFQGGALTTGVFNTSGAFVYAENSGGAATIFDGINFAADASLVPGDNNSTFHAGLNTPLAQDGRYSNGLQMITLGTGVIPALVVGQSYRIQLLIADGRGGAVGRTVALDGTNLGQYAYAVGAPDYSWGSPLLVTGTFVADSTSQSFTLDNFDDNGSVGAQYNAVLLYQVPEPSTVLICGLGSLALLRRRRN